MTDESITCPNCEGRGVLSLPYPPECPHCDGTGRERDDDEPRGGLCYKCGGTGIIDEPSICRICRGEGILEGKQLERWRRHEEMNKRRMRAYPPTPNPGESSPENQ